VVVRLHEVIALITAHVSRSKIEALASCLSDSGLDTLNSAELRRAKFRDLRHHFAVATADIENRTIVCY
jgi:hypothetical protein